MDDYSVDKQKLLLSYLLSDADLWARSSSIVEPEYFHNSLQKAVKFIKTYSSKFNGIPTPAQVKAESQTEIPLIDSMKESDKDWLLTTLEQFCRHRALDRWIVRGPELIEHGKYGQLEQGLKDALLISLYKNLGTNYFNNPKERLLLLRSNNGQTSTGWKALDEKLYGGMSRGELHLFAGNSGTGKSLFLQNIALNWALTGLNVVYITLEMSEELIAMRLDAMLTGIGTKDLFKQIETVHDTIKFKSRGAGDIWIKYMSQGSNANQISAYLKELEIKEGKRPDALIIDYLDLLHPKDKRISPTDMFIKDKYVSEELRGVANEGNGPDHKLLLVSASQLNRSGVEEIEFSHANIAGGKSKIDTADGVYGIYTSKVMKERGRYQLQLLKTRNSAGTGDKIDLAYDIESMRITDLEEEQVKQNDILSKFKENRQETAKSDISPTVKPRNILSILDEIKNNK